MISSLSPKELQAGIRRSSQFENFLVANQNETHVVKELNNLNTYEGKINKAQLHLPRRKRAGRECNSAVIM